MFTIIGIVVVFGCIAAGYLMEHGNLRVLMQPAELIIIAGASAGTVLIANPLHVLKQIFGGLLGAFGSSKFHKQRYVDSLKMMYELLQKARKEGLVALETDIEDPAKSPLFTKYNSMTPERRCSFCSRRISEVFPTTSPLKGTPTRNHTARKQTTATGSCPR